VGFGSTCELWKKIAGQSSYLNVVSQFRRDSDECGDWQDVSHAASTIPDDTLLGVWLLSPAIALIAFKFSGLR